MSWRTVVISRCAKLDFKMNYMIVRQEGEVHKIYIHEIYVLIIESTAVSMTAALLYALIKEKVKVIFCDPTRNPVAELVSYYGSHNTSGRCREQMEWTERDKVLLWTDIVRSKIRNQARLLERKGLEAYRLLESYIGDVRLGDETQREGHAAKVYFNALFGTSFTRDEESNINAALNYGYAILLSAINREVVALGYLTQFGLCHSNQFNPFNFSCDLIESLRGLVDKTVVDMDLTHFTKDEKYQLVNLLSEEVIIDKQRHVLSGAIRIYCKSVMDALTASDLSLVRFIEYEL
ncbi:type II CRISPR-associated endonuclease Cas1 [Veillonella montpellierensis]|uniref:type II CRISPR-associated endonuclease Cas1 n=1 Tax=Veillonella montpellierensis TaxID=187328 RepID=UPI000409F0F5|nr:type II CRISPR-associated endonuclease Cas1 [Veillonella montpellierensis]